MYKHFGREVIAGAMALPQDHADVVRRRSLGRATAVLVAAAPPAPAPPYLTHPVTLPCARENPTFAASPQSAPRPPPPTWQETVYLAVYRNFMEAVDAIDNGGPRSSFICCCCVFVMGAWRAGACSGWRHWGKH